MTRILFIGNSYTFYWEMPTMLRELCRDAGIAVQVSSVTKGGTTIKRLADENEPCGKKLLDTVSGSTKYDFIFLQEQSEKPALDPESFFEGVRNMKKLLDKYQPGAKVLMYSTWNRNDGSPDLEKYGSKENMLKLLQKSYNSIGAELGFKVSQVGEVFAEIAKEHPEIVMHHTDNTHQSKAGSYASACTHFASVFGISPVGNGFCAGLDDETAYIIQSAAAKASGV